MASSTLAVNINTINATTSFFCVRNSIYFDYLQVGEPSRAFCDRISVGLNEEYFGSQSLQAVFSTSEVLVGRTLDEGNLVGQRPCKWSFVGRTLDEWNLAGWNRWELILGERIAVEKGNPKGFLRMAG